MTELSSVAFVLIMCDSKFVIDILKKCDEIDIVTEIIHVDGPWKILLKLESSLMDKIRDVVRWKLRKMEGIESTLTLVQHMT
ncbi:MAG: Lrp/AsnC ligand binding domain-containing protein [Nitrosopumilus sp.]|uniref:Lrp/AsnC ligand binding domain-containing protein n=1 Tax=Nitrosopumilus sp. TaxID=2024843 RepID=UPI00247BAF07|nr:Lrp/AsnC ligand binding domain-containing protein [Nitrosopumilus sp.]MCV0391938.1 Lrp/AsnC ligand binding domain-containing protein [Nitrosopumilus sp.]